MATFKVTDTKEISTMTQAGTTQIVYRIWIVTERGATGTLDVSQADWTPEKVAQLLLDKVQSLDLAFMLSEGQ